jgi:hypothetical protein
MKTFYVTFQRDSIFGRYYLSVMAVNAAKVTRFCTSRVPGWCMIYNEKEFEHMLKVLPDIESEYFLYPHEDSIQRADGTLAVPR